MLLLKYFKEILLVILMLLILGLYALYGYEKFFLPSENDNLTSEILVVPDKNESNNEKETVKNFYVEIKGAVKKPGVYLASEKSIINDIVTLAGGFNKGAYTSNINLSKKLSEEMVIYVYDTKEYEKLNTKDPEIIYVEIEKECNCPVYDINDCVSNGSSVIVPGDKENQEDMGSQKPNEQINAKININTASKEELMTLNGIGEVKAQSIIDYRKQNGPFTKIEDLTNVSGITENALAKFKENITV